MKSRRLKQLHWDKIKTPQQGTVWAKDQPQVNLNLIELENLFQVNLLALTYLPNDWAVFSYSVRVLPTAVHAAMAGLHPGGTSHL